MIRICERNALATEEASKVWRPRFGCAPKATRWARERRGGSVRDPRGREVTHEA